MALIIRIIVLMWDPCPMGLQTVKVAHMKLPKEPGSFMTVADPIRHGFLNYPPSILPPQGSHLSKPI